MSDGSSGNAFGEALENMTTNAKQAVSGTIADFTKSAANQVKGTGGISGSFTPGQTQAPSNPNVAPGLQGGDLFSPDKTAGQQPQAGQGPKPLTTSGQQLARNPTAKSPEEVAEIQRIEQELRSMHQQYYQDFLAKSEGRDRKTQVETQEKEQEKQEEKMQDLQKKEEKKQESAALMQQKTAAERKGGMG